METTVHQLTSMQLPQSIKRKVIIRILGIIELLIGILCITLGAVIIAKKDIKNSSIGEGIWSGAWISIAGGLGVAAGGERSSILLINLHMGFSIFASVVSAVLAIITGTWGLFGYYLGFGFYAIIPCMTILGIISFILLIVSAALCCASSPYTCCSCCCGNQSLQNLQSTQASYAQNSATFVQGSGMVAVDGYSPLYNEQ